MEELTSWLQLSISEGSPVQIWMAVAAGSVLLLMLIRLLVLLKRRMKKYTPTFTPVTEMPAELPVLEISNLQGIGARKEQQDAFAISPIASFDKDGLFMVLCDGMGGMAEGGTIAMDTALGILSAFPFDPDFLLEWIKLQSQKIYRNYRGRGGTTLVAVLVQKNLMHFWCAGDSDLFLIRDGSLYAMHLSQDYRNDLVIMALSGALPVEDAFTDAQACALSQYIGKENVKCAFNRIPFQLQPGDFLLLCSDGITNTLSLTTILEAMVLNAKEVTERLKEAILSTQDPGQDNYTAIVLKYNGEGCETEWIN